MERSRQASRGGSSLDEEAKFATAVSSLHEAMLDDSRLAEASKLIDEACGSVGNNIIIYRGDTQADFEWLFAKLHYRGELNEEINQVYPDHYREIDERLPRFMKLPDSQPIAVPDIYTPEELRRSATYNELLDMADGQRGLNMRMEEGLADNTRMFFILADPVDPNGWSSDHLKMLKRLLPHIRQYVRVRQALAANDSVDASLAALLGNAAVGVVFVDRSGKILEVNDCASRTLREGDGLSVRNGFVVASSCADSDRLATLMNRVLPKGDGNPVSDSMAVQRAWLLPRLALHGVPLPSTRWDFGVRRPAAILLIIDPGLKPRIAPGPLGELLGLTDAESHVAAALAKGLSVREIATSSRRKESSVRWLVKQMHAKLGVHRQADLVRMVLAAGQHLDPHL